jgi:hypothetical protein
VSEPPAVPDEADPGGAAEPPDVDRLAAALRADSADLDIYARVLTTSLADALPANMVEIARDQSLRDRLAGRPGVVRSVRVSLGDLSIELATDRSGVPVARAARAVRGVVISSKPISVEEWTRLLAAGLAERAQESGAARAALSRLLGAT